MKALAWLNRWLLIAAGLALGVVILLTTVDVLSSTLRGRPITGVYDVVGTALVYLVFCGAPEIFRTRANITVDVIDHFVSRRSLVVLNRLAMIATFTFLLLLEYSMIQPALDAIKFDDHKPDSGIPYWFLWAPILIGTLVGIIATAITMWAPPPVVPAPAQAPP